MYIILIMGLIIACSNNKKDLKLIQVNNYNHLKTNNSISSKKVIDTTKIHCNINILKNISEKLDNLTEKDLNLFLMTFDKKCKNNIEYEEFSNELLFQILDKYPFQTIKILNRNNKISLPVILNELKEPVNDGIDLNKIIKQLKNNPNRLSLKILRILKNIQ